jgi:hypothetical protein
MIKESIQQFRAARQQRQKMGAISAVQTKQRMGLAQREAENTKMDIRATRRSAEQSTESSYNPEEKINAWYAEIDAIREERGMRADMEQSTTGAMDVDPLSNPRPQTFNDTVEGETGSRLVTELQEELGLTLEQAAGLVGNLHVETGGFKFLQEIEPAVPGSRGGLGFAQWTGPRRVAFESWAEENGVDTNSYEANKGFLLHEIQNTSEGNFMDELRAAETAADAAMVVSSKFLRPGIPHNDRRVAVAEQYSRG